MVMIRVGCGSTGLELYAVIINRITSLPLILIFIKNMGGGEGSVVAKYGEPLNYLLLVLCFGRSYMELEIRTAKSVTELLFIAYQYVFTSFDMYILFDLLFT